MRSVPDILTADVALTTHRPQGTRPVLSSPALGHSIEQKYVFSLSAQHKLRECVDAFLKADPDYIEGVVTSIYYDSPALALYAEKRNSDYLKVKVRLRWYGSLEALPPNQRVPCFLEVKRKVGALRDKHRFPVQVPARALTVAPFSRTEILGMPRFLEERGFRVERMLVPLLVIQYHRRRYVDAETAARISLDTRITCPQANERIVPCVVPLTLPVGVLEVKSRGRQLPRVLAAVAGDLRKEAFSKYALCCESLLQPLGRNL